jgi:NAD(P)H dehydrogenase (quinone)
LAAAPAAWPSQDDSSPAVTILIVYDSRTGNTETLARAVGEGVEAVEGAAAVLRKHSDVGDAEITGADGVVVGSPVHWGNLSADTKRLLDRVGGALASAGEVGAGSTAGNRTAGAFVTGGSVASGKELARIGILTSLLSFKFVVIGGEDAGGFGTLGPQATTGPSDPGVGEAELEEARRFGARFATLTKQLRR